MDTQNRMARACYPGATGWWPDYLAGIYDAFAWEVADASIAEAAEYLATRAYYYVDSARDTFMIGDEAAMRQLLTEDRNV